MKSKNGCEEVNTTKVNVAILQTQMKGLTEQVEKIDKKVDDLATNFEDRFDALDRKVAKWGGGIATIIVIIEILSWFKH